MVKGDPFGLTKAWGEPPERAPHRTAGEGEKRCGGFRPSPVTPLSKAFAKSRKAAWRPIVAQGGGGSDHDSWWCT